MIPQTMPYFCAGGKSIIPKSVKMSSREDMDWKMESYEIPDNVLCLVRDRNLKTNKVTEHVYKQSPAASKLIHKLAHKGDSEITVCTHNAVAHIEPHNYIGEL